ncbi:MAG: hypothetical protein JRJ84_22835 [Deltaproteobacteria bacterium]|nr:hypothetical protein [Deltaproteobacteria bacterium]
MRRGLFALLLAALLAPACVKPKPPVVSATADPVALAPLRTDFATNEVVPAPERLREALTNTLEERNLKPRPVAEAELAELFGAGRNSRHRLERLAVSDDGATLLVLVEAECTFFAQVAGRYRWIVAVKLTFADRDDLDAALVRAFDVPVFLQFSHEKEDAALAEATPNIERKLGEMLDEILAARQGG